MTRLYKTYNGRVQALDGLALQVEPGDIVGLIGPNGAGKTTLMRILATLLEPTSGEAFIGGYSTTRESWKARRIIGFMPDFFGIYDNLKVWEYLEFFALSFKIEKNRVKNLIAEVLELTSLKEEHDSYVDELSRGMKQRLCLARTLLHDPQVLLLDEPASGLDPSGRIILRKLLKELNVRGKTILISSHILPELADICHSFAIIDQGRLLARGRYDDLLQQISPHPVFLLSFLGSGNEVVKILSSLNGILILEQEKDRILFKLEGNREELPLILKILIEKGIQVMGLEEKEANLEELFLKITSGAAS
ncbi:MAG: ABC transporter ATP-binding protein [bacterium]